MSGGSHRAVASIDASAWLSEDDPLPPEDLAPRKIETELGDLYRREAARLARYLSRRVGCPQEAMDLAHEAFSRFFALHRTRPSAIERPAAYLQRVAQNLLNDRTRTNARRASHLHVVADAETLCGPDQQRLLETRDMLQRLEAAMLKLKPKTREIFLAHRIDGLSYAEIAERTGLSIKGVEKQMSKAIAHVDRTLDTF